MSSPSETLRHRPLRAPRDSGAALIEPPLSEAPALVAANQQLRVEYRVDFLGRSLGDLARAARRELVEEALAHTRGYRDVELPAGAWSDLIFLAGHQPQLFHPGVWFKNFALGTLARRLQAVAVNLQVDSDTIKSSAIAVPSGPPQRPHLAMIPLDESGPVVPFEERSIKDREVFARFGRRAADAIGSLVPDPLLKAFWPTAVARSRETGNLGACLAQSRHQCEGRWGIQTLELPQSRVCSLPSFAWFLLALLDRADELLSVYNEQVAQYRLLNRIRSAHHPVPDLAVDGPWRESPFWIWRRDDPRRRRLFVRRRGNEILLSDRHHDDIALPLADGGKPIAAIARLLELAAEGVKIRSRALITTLWARLVLGDLFLHGIGGAKYDQLTDALMERLFGLTPPGFLVVSATLQLPIDRPRVAWAEEARDIDRRLRDLIWHPENAIDESAAANGVAGFAELVAAKRDWTGTAQTPQNARTRWSEIRRINEALQPAVAPQRERLLARRQEAVHSLRAEKILSSREYGFCLYPERLLRGFFSGLLPKDA